MYMGLLLREDRSEGSQRVNGSLYRGTRRWESGKASDSVPN